MPASSPPSCRRRPAPSSRCRSTTSASPSTSRPWIDLRLAGTPHGTRLLDGTPVVLVVTRGGVRRRHFPGGLGPQHRLPARILVEFWGADLTLVEREFTLVGVNPALDEFAELLRRTAEEAAAEAGAALAARHAA